MDMDIAMHSGMVNEASDKTLTSENSRPSFFFHLIRTTSTPVHRVILYLWLYLRWYLGILLILWISPSTTAQESFLNCSSITDNYVGNAQAKFQVMDWVDRGLCIRKIGNDFQCYSSLQNVLANNLNEIRKAEYSGAAGVLALLPTIGALLGTPTNEIWRLLTMIPFGGVLAMASSFGGAMLPVKIKDYESAFMKKNIKGGLRGGKSTLTLSKDATADDQRIEQRADILMQRVEQKLLNELQDKVPKMYIWVGLIGMGMLLAGAHVAMAFVELGAVLPWWCSSKWWVHLWYLMVICSAAVDNYVQLPFSKQWKICLSDVPYDIDVARGDDITNYLPGNRDAIENIKKALPQLNTLKTGIARFAGTRQLPAEPRNILFVLVSVTDKSHRWSSTFLRSVSKISSIAVFIVGTACFASAQLLSIAMATFVLTCVLGSGIFGRAIASWIVTGIESADPMVHFVADEEREAHYVLARLFSIKLPGRSALPSRQVQVELNGHIFLDRRRVVHRSPWPMRILGIIASPYDLAKAVYKMPFGDGDVEEERLGKLEEGHEDRKGAQGEVQLKALRTDTFQSNDSSEADLFHGQVRRSTYASGDSST
ncbi:hypothetical protein BT63DRAFT_422059 [Microthyrium microscopicum]|uniref:Uncharacterized protein n=1 Tax=Microthyrium microscopicum TaxID=703497 RepID=A0A6A6UR67_9PEZI|nr:hypothetical protein BT63DRAFT_422059 [Microthyrium microscopicum]